VETCGSRAGTAVLETWVAFAKALGDAVIQGDTAIAGAAVIQGDTTVVVAIQGDTTVVAFGLGVAIQGDIIALLGTVVATAVRGPAVAVVSFCLLAVNRSTVLFMAVGGCSRSLMTYSLAGIMESVAGVEPHWP